MHGLDFNNDAHLRGRVGRPRGVRTASVTFQHIWDEIDRLRREKLKEDPDTFAEKCGFSRATYFAYGRHGHAPFSLLEKMASRAKAKIQAAVITAKSDLNVTPGAQPHGGDMADLLQPIVELLQSVPEDQREWAAGAIYSAAQAAIARIPFAEPSGGRRAPRGRNKR